VLEQTQAELEGTQVTVVRAMNDLDPVVPLRYHTKIDDPDMGQVSCDHQAGQACRLRDMAFMRPEPSTLLVREEGCDPGSFGVPITRFFDQFHIRDQIDRLISSRSAVGGSSVATNNLIYCSNEYASSSAAAV
jgi:hypothetical protein